MTSTSWGKRIWCCGTLQAGAQTAGVTDALLVIMATGHYIEKTWANPFGLHLVAIGLSVLFLLASNLCLLYGIVKKQCWLLLPWMVLHLGAILGVIIWCSIQFDQMESQRFILIFIALAQIYFLFIVFLHYLELRSIPSAWAEARGQPEGQQDLPDAGDRRPNNCLIDLELEEKPDSRGSDPDFSLTKDDTFTQLASSRTSAPNGLTLTPIKSSISGGTLPTPDEVISLPQPPPFSSSFEEPRPSEEVSTVIPRRSATSWKSSATLDGEKAGPQLEPLLPPAKSESKILFTQVDNNFSPFRSKNAAQNGPKMKVFLPQGPSSDDDDDDDEDDDEEEEDHVPEIDKKEEESDLNAAKIGRP